MAPASRSCVQALAQNTADGVRLCSLEIPQPPSTQEEIDDEEESPKVLKVDALKVRTSYKLYERDPFLCSTIFAQCAKNIFTGVDDAEARAHGPILRSPCRIAPWTPDRGNQAEAGPTRNSWPRLYEGRTQTHDDAHPRLGAAAELSELR